MHVRKGSRLGAGVTWEATRGLESIASGEEGVQEVLGVHKLGLGEHDRSFFFSSLPFFSFIKFLFPF